MTPQGVHVINLGVLLEQVRVLLEQVRVLLEQVRIFLEQEGPPRSGGYRKYGYKLRFSIKKWAEPTKF
jgi:hypothetical protein